MAVAAYASLVSLMDVLDSVQHPARRHRLHLDKEQIQSLQEKVQFLQDFLELHSQRISDEVEDLAKQLVVAADEADDIIDFHVVNQLRETSQDKSIHMAALSSFHQDIDKISKKIDSITEKLMMVKNDRDDVQEQQPRVSLRVGSTALPSDDKNTMVGFDERLLQVVGDLIRGEANLQILPIVGMGGIGKTTLAQNAFDHPHIVYRFDIRIWFTISQQYSVREIFQKYFEDDKENKQGENVAELGECFYKLLFGKRYLIIMDDVWSIKVWEDFKFSFPDNGNGSRILVTTRLLDVARPLGSCNHCFKMNFLGEDQSWNLLHEKVFGRKGCPYPELVEIGRKIAKGCRGLPLAIVVIAGLLAKSDKTPEYWEFVAKNVTSFVNSRDDNYCLRILSLSYNSLPIHLKPCFLYMKVFPEDYMIKASKLIKLWISEGFLKPIRGKSLEEAGVEYLKDLTDRNLILIRKWTKRGKIKTCSVHDTLRELCFRESDREHLIRIPKTQRIPSSVSPKEYVCCLCGRRLDIRRHDRIHLQEILVGLQSTAVTSESVCAGCNNMYQDIDKLRWVNVFRKDIDDSSGKTFPQHTKLRYLLVVNYEYTRLDWKLLVPGTISLLWNLQFLDLGLLDTPSLSEIWEMPKLRYLNIGDLSLPDPLEGQDSSILDNLSALWSGDFRCTQEVVKRIPNLKKLSATCWYSPVDLCYYLSNLAQLSKLESLILEGYSRLEEIIFPTSLKKLSLRGCKISWEKMTIIGSSLPNLEVLKLDIAFRGQEWNPIEGEFLQLKVLYIWNTDLIRWGAENFHFPNLKSLYLKCMWKLEKIPVSIGDIDTLLSIHLDQCSESAINSAKEILKDQKEKGNECLQVHVAGQQVRVSV